MTAETPSGTGRVRELPCLDGGTPSSRPINPMGHREAPVRVLIEDWAERARRTLHAATASHPGAAFEAFVYAWIAFNAWGSCCFEARTDADLVGRLAQEEQLQALLTQIREQSSTFDDDVRAFGALWPVYRVSQLARQPRVLSGARDAFVAGGRSEVLRYLAEHGRGIERGPRCLPHAHPSGVNTNWSHALPALYMVRCNLFHGGKSFQQEADVEIVDLAARVLVPVVAKIATNDDRAWRALRKPT